jgi:hypothetical protein
MSRRSRLAIIAIAVVSLVLFAAFSCGKGSEQPVKPQAEVKLGAPAPGGITIPPPGQAPTIPGDIPGGAPSATLQQAATFAWQEFIAATWPAQPSGTTFNRDVPDPNGIYGATAGSSTGAPLVWETFRHKVEIFPGTTSPSNYMNNTPPHGYSPTAPDLGYNDPPQYNYAPGQVSGVCSGTTPAASTPWVNADENSQIFLDTMYAGTLDPTGAQPGADQEILFLAKGNHVQYQYIVNPASVGQTQIYNALWNHSFPSGTPPASDNPIYNQALANFATYQAAVLAKQYSGGPTPPPLTAPYVSFPAGTIEAKSAWRPLTQKEAGSGRFHMATVRHYQSVANNGNAPFCYVDQPWGMVALHIIQKTPTAPYFIYATFSQADNILTSSGQPVEDADGNMIVSNPGPNLDSGYYTPPPNPMPTPGKNPIQANLATPTQYETYNTMTAQCKAMSRLYLVNSAGQYTPQGPICVNQRTHAIPPTIISVNQAAHAAITNYNNQYNGGKPNPWLAYKLINVQSVPMTKTPGVLYTGADSGTFYQSNDVVETNYNLQFFSGRLVVNPSFGQLMSDYNPGPTPAATTQFLNTFFLKAPNGSSYATYNMGGCMGCHGNAQQAGDDFSFILNVGRNDAPEPLPSVSMTKAQPAAVAAKVKKFHLPG